MRSDTVLSSPVHLKCTDLDLKWLAVRSDQCRMQGLVHVLFRHCNIILETPRDRLVHLMDDTERRITVFDRINDDTHGKQIIDLVKRLILVDHLFVNAEKVLCPSVDLRLDSGCLDVLADRFYDLIDEFLTCILFQCNFFDQIVIDFRLQIFQGKIIQFYLDLGNTEPVCDRRVDIHGLTRFFLLLRR